MNRLERNLLKRIDTLTKKSILLQKQLMQSKKQRLKQIALPPRKLQQSKRKKIDLLRKLV